MPEHDSSPTAATLAPPIRIALAFVKTPIGRFQIAAAEDRVLHVRLPGKRSVEPAVSGWLGRELVQRAKTPALAQAVCELDEYFGGRRRQFEVRLAPPGTAFQQRVWALIATIPYGETRTYGDLACALGSLHLARVVGTATAANPIPILIPCHRVIARDGSMAGFAGGLSRKIWLLRHERALLA